MLESNRCEKQCFTMRCDFKLDFTVSAHWFQQFSEYWLVGRFHNHLSYTRLATVQFECKLINCT